MHFKHLSSQLETSLVKHFLCFDYIDNIDAKYNVSDIHGSRDILVGVDQQHSSDNPSLILLHS